MDFEWDESKRALLIRERKLDLLWAARIFEGLVIEKVDRRRDYGEERLLALGKVGQDYYNVVYTERDGIIRLITAWKEGVRDKRRYEAGIAQTNWEDG